MSWLAHARIVLTTGVHLGLIVCSSYCAFWLRFDGAIPEEMQRLWLQYLPALLLIRLLTFFPLRLQQGLWRYTGFGDLRNIIIGVGASSLGFFSVVYWLLGITQYPRSVFLVDALLLTFLMGAVRMTRRAVRELGRVDRGKRVLVYGAGDAGEMIVRDMTHDVSHGYAPIGFIDDDTTKVGLRIHGIPVLGTRDELAAVMADYRPDEVLVAIPGADSVEIRHIVKNLERFNVPISTVPSLRALVSGRVALSKIRKLVVEDLLHRAPIDSDPTPVRLLIQGRRVLVTGAGGSIGSELCRQIAPLLPSSLVLLDRYENSLFDIACELSDAGHAKTITAVLADITDAARIDVVLTEHRPELIFHAAAHKHVPMMESNPCEAVKNNIRGTRMLAEAAELHGVRRYVLISTDKAISPTSVMGATKRVAEMIVQDREFDSPTIFLAVRFGNVLGSNGSVVPRFIQQIEAGGPVTVTHPDMRRFFMLIPEAVQLVMQAVAGGREGHVYMVEMGNQIKVVDMARDLIRLAGLIPDEDIKIVFTGVRSGEKLFEELAGDDETVRPSGIEKILQVEPKRVTDSASFRRQLTELEHLAIDGDADAVVDQLQRIVPTFTHAGVLEAPAASRFAPPVVEQTRDSRVLEPVPGAVCPACRSLLVCRSRTRSIRERVRKALTGTRPHRCHDCGWRGWMPIADEWNAVEVRPLQPDKPTPAFDRIHTSAT